MKPILKIDGKDAEIESAQERARKDARLINSLPAISEYVKTLRQELQSDNPPTPVTLPEPDAPKVVDYATLTGGTALTFATRKQIPDMVNHLLQEYGYKALDNFEPLTADARRETKMDRYYQAIRAQPTPVDAGQAGAAGLPEKAKQQGRYRLTGDEIERRKRKVKQAEELMKESDYTKTWQQIADDVGIPERTLRDWRHNPIYQ